MTEIILFIGIGILIIGGIGLLIAAFRTSILWGLAVLLIAPVAVIYLVVHWQDAKGPFKLQIIGLLIIVVVANMNDGSSSHIVTSSSFSSGSISTYRNSSLSSPKTLDQQFSCDGRQHCSQMRSRAEAEFFIRNCPNTKMDGDHDGIPCENDSRF
ncbi:Excalibur calcium-binding domain-containing protein [Amphritea atlantica]|uniref:Excalibur calcium-binding domain-containing protein n=2 Tax=Amphritea atlantica TaxID=355243 RepID=A0A1H9M8D5_9GAMM|nr:Excalibur calcium-binding domain-containing protein [Amphritea atlantica]